MRNRRGQQLEIDVTPPESDAGLPLTKLKIGQSGKIVAINGGHAMLNRLNSLGIRPGKEITKVSSMVMQGPITVKFDGSQVAIGFGIAKRILVSPEQQKE